MSDAIAISAITRTLIKKLHAYFGHVFPDETSPGISAKPLDKVDASEGDVINLYLYHMTINSSWRNMDTPWKVKPGELGRPPLPLNLYYLLTAYSTEEAGEVLTGDLRGTHRLLGMAMSILHDFPILTAEDINKELDEADSNAYRFVAPEKVRLTVHPLTLDDLSKIWTGFQASYRLAVAYEVSVVLIESQHPNAAALPVLRRGSKDRGPRVVSNLFPTITEIRRPAGTRFGIQLGDEIEIHGQRLSGDSLEINVAHPKLAAPASLELDTESTAQKLTVTLPPADTNNEWAAGVNSVSVTIKNDGDDFVRTTNQMPLPLSSKLTINETQVTRVGDIATITIGCVPDVYKDQQVLLLLASKEVPPTPFLGDSTSSLEFAITLTDDEVDTMPAGGFVVRLRVDGVDSLPVIIEETETEPKQKLLKFDPNQKVIII
ncbi:MAG: DUF4255 domain-containing protein [Chloroflexi bacterium]|nr:MAG: DUF4255 domain-containing protein [Chloroflexota bacterium]